MTPLLWSPYYPRGSSFVLPRPYQTRFAMKWWQHSTLSVGNPFVFQEVPFGGYRLHIEIAPWFYSWSSRTATLADLFTTVYALAPGDTTPINAGSVEVGWEVDPLNGQPTITFLNVPSDDHYSYFKLPPAPPGYWLPPLPDKPPP